MNIHNKTEPAIGLNAMIGRLAHNTVTIYPGLLLACIITILVLIAHGFLFSWGVSPLFIAAFAGMIWRATVGVPDWAEAGLGFAQKRILRFAIPFLGLQLTLGQLLAIGPANFMLLVFLPVATIAFTLATARLLGVERDQAMLIGVGTGICGAAAIVATNSVLRARDGDTAYALACITIFGTLAMLVYPLAAAMLAMSPGYYGLWVGGSVHEVAQVVATAAQGGQPALDVAMVAKLGRVLLLAPIVLALSVLAVRRGAGEDGPRARVPVPWFAFGFIALMLLNSWLELPAGATAWASQMTNLLLTVALCALGASTRFRDLLAKGVRPLIIAAGSTLFISLAALVLFRLTLQA